MKNKHAPTETTAHLFNGYDAYLKDVPLDQALKYATKSKILRLIADGLHVTLYHKNGYQASIAFPSIAERNDWLSSVVQDVFLYGSWAVIDGWVGPLKQVLEYALNDDASKYTDNHPQLWWIWVYGDYRLALFGGGYMRDKFRPHYRLWDNGVLVFAAQDISLAPSVDIQEPEAVEQVLFWLADRSVNKDSFAPEQRAWMEQDGIGLSHALREFGEAFELSDYTQ